MLKKILSLFLLGVTLVMGTLPVNVFANDLDGVIQDLEVPFDARITINQELGLIIVSSRVEDEIDLVDVNFGDQAEPTALPEKPTSATISHKIYDRNNILMATAYVKIKGWYSESDRWSEISSITTTFEGQDAHFFSSSSSKSGNTGTVSIYFSGVHLQTGRYKIDYYGKVTQD